MPYFNVETETNNNVGPEGPPGPPGPIGPPGDPANTEELTTKVVSLTQQLAEQKGELIELLEDEIGKSLAIDQNTETGVGHIRFWTGTIAEYDALPVKNPQVIYYTRGV